MNFALGNLQTKHEKNQIVKEILIYANFDHRCPKITLHLII